MHGNEGDILTERDLCDDFILQLLSVKHLSLAASTCGVTGTSAASQNIRSFRRVVGAHETFHLSKANEEEISLRQSHVSGQKIHLLLTHFSLHCTSENIRFKN